MSSRYMEPQEREKLKSELDQLDRRWGLLFSVGVNTGLRLSDLLSIHRGTVRSWLKTGKAIIWNHKSRDFMRVPLGKELAKELSAYVVERGLTSNLFHGRSKDNGASRQHVSRVWKAAADACGIEGTSPHSMRRTFAIEQYKAGKSVKEIQGMLYHDRPQTTAIYLLERGTGS